MRCCVCTDPVRPNKECRVSGVEMDAINLKYPDGDCCPYLIYEPEGIEEDLARWEGDGGR